MLFVPPGQLFGTFDTGLSAGSRQGTTITASGSTHTKGSYGTLIALTTYPAFGLWVRAKSNALATTRRNVLMDIAIGDGTSGGSESIIVPNLIIGPANAGSGRTYYFPVQIPAGVSVRARTQSSTASQTTVVAAFTNFASFMHAPPVWDAYGVNTGTSQGTSVTPASGSFGSWTSIGTTSRNHRYWMVHKDQLSDTSILTLEDLIEIGIGPDSSNVSTIYRGQLYQESTEFIDSYLPHVGYFPVASGTALWARIASGETEARGIGIYGG